MRKEHLYKGRGTSQNPKNRFEKLSYSHTFEDWSEDDFAQKPKTIYYKDNSKTLITYNKSPDIGYSASINPYRGCSHGCIYCYARQTHEYLGFSSGLDFESKILVKTDAPELLRKELSAKKWQAQMNLATSFGHNHWLVFLPHK